MIDERDTSCGQKSLHFYQQCEIRSIRQDFKEKQCVFER